MSTLHKCLLAAALLPLIVSCGSGGGSGTSKVTLSVEVSSLALSVNDQTTNPALTGTPRKIVVVNNGAIAATNVAYTASPALPAGTTVEPASCASMAPKATCVFTVTPGATPSAAPNDANPTPVTLSFAGSNTETITVDVSVVTYGSVHQGGYVFAIDDATVDTGSVGGKVAALTDEASRPSWGIQNTQVGGIDESSSASSPDSCDGATDGACNTARIKSVAGTNFSSYEAASLCDAPIAGRSDWYLPAICELSYGNSGSSSGCGTASAPLLQNMVSNLSDKTYGDLIGVNYWSSTESATDPSSSWAKDYGTTNPFHKTSTIYVRCVRKLTP